MGGKGFKWTSDEDGKLRRWAAEGMRVRHIALKLRRSENGIKHRARQLGVAIEASSLPRFRFEAVARSSTK